MINKSLRVKPNQISFHVIKHCVSCESYIYQRDNVLGLCQGVLWSLSPCLEKTCKSSGNSLIKCHKRDLDKRTGEGKSEQWGECLHTSVFMTVIIQTFNPTPPNGWMPAERIPAHVCGLTEFAFRKQLKDEFFSGTTLLMYIWLNFKFD